MRRCRGGCFSPERVRETETNLDRIRGSLVGGAIGDALGYTVEFMQEEQIFRKYGSSGITEYELTNGKALVSDDTQMTLFTANGILVGDTRLSMRGIEVIQKCMFQMHIWTG